MRRYSGKFMRRRRDWKRLLRWILLGVLGADGLSTRLQLACFGLFPYLSQNGSVVHEACGDSRMF